MKNPNQMVYSDTDLHEDLFNKSDEWLATFVIVLSIVCIFMMFLLF